MGWTSWLVLGVSILGLYLLGLIGYRIFLNTKALQANILKSKALVDDLRQFEELEITPAVAAKQSDLAKVLLNRRKIQRLKLERREARQRRLVQRISEIEIDKR